MPNPYRIVDLPSFNGLPTGNEIFEVSVGGTGSFQIILAILASARQANTVSSGGTYNLSVSNYGDVLVTTTSAVTVNLPSSAGRNGVPVSVVAATSSTPAITISPNGTDLAIGQNSLTITNAWGSYTLWPLTSGGWYQK